jgi:diketogulonate reductase-like aldo/keto reductase
MIPLTAYNNASIPPFMYGTAWKKGATAQLVELAVDSGFTAIDTANQLIHYDEALVGEALLALDRKGIKRESLFLQTKFTSASGQDHRTPYDPSADLATQVKQSFTSSLEHLHTDIIDSYVLHGPHYRGMLGPEDWEVWSAMEGIYQSGKARMIGISNVNPRQLAQLCENAAVKPMVVQNRCFAVQGWDHDVRKVCRAHGIIYQGFSLLTANPHVLVGPEIGRIAHRLGTGPAQVIFRFAMQAGILPLTGTTSDRHMKEDLGAMRLELSEEEVQIIETLAA